MRVAPQRVEVELGDLAGGCVAQLGTAVARVHAEERREPVEIAVALLVPYVCPLATDDDRHVRVLVGGMTREVHPQVALGEILKTGFGSRARCAAGCHLIPPPGCDWMSPLYRRSVYPYLAQGDRTSEIRFKDPIGV